MAAKKRLNMAYLLKESFGQLWSYQREGWARRFFDLANPQHRFQRGITETHLTHVSIRDCDMPQ